MFRSTRFRNSGNLQPRASSVGSVAFDALGGTFVNPFADFSITSDVGIPFWGLGSNGKIVSRQTSISAQSSFVNANFIAANCFAEVTMTTAQDAGLILRFQDQNNFYVATICDDSGSTPTTNIRLFKRVGGFGSLGSANLTWARGTLKTIRFTATGTALEVLVDGTSVISTTDSQFSSGKIGLRSSALQDDEFSTFRYGAL